MKITIFEIYVKNEKTLQRGWDIKYVRSTEDLIKTFPFFDVIITRDNISSELSESSIINWMDQRTSMQYRSGTKLY